MRKYLIRLFSLLLVLLLGTFINVSAKEENRVEQTNVFYKAEMLYRNKVCNRGSINIINLYNINGDSQYILVEGDKSYLIFDTYLNDFIEFSSLCSSPYSMVSSKYKIIYFPIGNYFYVNCGKYYSLKDNTLISDDTLCLLRKEMVAVQNKIMNNKHSFEENDRGLMSSGSVQYPYYFEHLINNMGSDTPFSYTGSCGYVAIGMVLSYYDSMITDNVIAETYDVTSSKAFSSYSAISSASYLQSPGIDDSFHDSLISLGRSQGYTSSTSYSISDLYIPFFFEDYFATRNMSCTSYYEDSSSSVVQFCKSAISYGYPVVIHIIGLDISVDYRTLNHEVVGYKYDSDGIYVNMGWQDLQTSICINNYTIESATYVTISNSHSHSNNYLWTYNGCSGTICLCGNKTCNHGSYTYTQYSSIIHKKTCNACGSQQNEAHHFQTVGDNQVCSDCGYVLTGHQHSYFYIWKNYTQHTASCLCGDMHDEVHAVPAGSFENGQLYATCLLCGGQATMGIVVQGNNVFPMSINGSYILPNGVIVLVDEDFEAYMNGTLVFIYPNDGIIRSSVIPYSIKRNDEKQD